MKLTKWFIYLEENRDSEGKTYYSKRYYMGKLKELKPNLEFIGEAEIDNSFFIATDNTRFYDSGKEMYSRGDLIKLSRTLEYGSELKGVVEDYLRLRFNYLPQLLKHFEPDAGGYYTPHMSKLKETI